MCRCSHAHYSIIIILQYTLKLGRSRLASCAFGTSNFALRARFIRFNFWGFCHFLFFIVPIYRVITKNITESTLGKSTSTVIKLLLPSRVYRSWATILQGWVGSSGVISGSFGWVGAYSAQRLQLLTVSLICWLMPGQNKHLWPVKDMPALLGDLRECASLFLCEMQ